MSGYKISESFAQRMKSTILRVDAMPESSSSGVIPVRFDERPAVGESNPLSRGTFTGSWPIGETKTVTLVTDTASTAAVTNYCVPVVTDDDEQQLTVIFGTVQGTVTAVEVQHVDSTECSLVIGGVDLTEIPGYSAGSIQLLGHTSNVNPSNTNTTVCVTLTWYSITQCETVTP